ncbi:MAG TPA: hypothetical protein VLG12_07640 [Candidatus Saccharimonadales bacterium]|nr:hypothetical protein [Candidatus Saccharimonadales bacterium]
MRKIEYLLIPPPAVERYGTTVNSVLQHTWQQRFGTEGVYISMGGKRTLYRPFFLKKYEVMAVLDHVGKLGPGYPKDIEPNEIAQAFQGKNICVIGGPEGEVYAAMGATVVGIDPNFKNLPVSKQQRLHEISEPLSDALASSMANRFDITTSSFLFDQGSGLNPDAPFGADPEKEQGVFSAYLERILQMTKKGGLSFHNGNMMPYALSGITQGRCRLIEAIQTLPEDTIDTTSTMVVIQKL